MDDQDRAPGRTRAALSGCGLVLLLLLVARSGLGDLGVQLVLLVSLVVVAVYAYGELTGRPVPLRRRRARVEEPVVVDTWRSERWIAEAVERGLRALDEWRTEQREA